MTDKQLFVSPKTKNASGFILSKSFSVSWIIFPIVADGEVDTAFKKYFGCEETKIFYYKNNKHI